MVLASTDGPSEEEQSLLQTAPNKFISTALDVDIPKQQNGLDCGVLVCKFAECVSRGGQMEFTQPQIAVIRKKIAE
uniref:Ubiquitin-like protease family profile domain-containing protein n=1 Tax=Ditylenchus dipsaci TaxID=166011 RepID=A0A915EUP0_9BILA